VISHPGWISSCRLINRGSWWGYRLEITFRLQLRWDPPSSFANVLVKNSTAEYLDLKSQIYGIYARWAVWGRQQLMNCNMGMESSAVANWGPLNHLLRHSRMIYSKYLHLFWISGLINPSQQMFCHAIRSPSRVCVPLSMWLHFIVTQCPCPKVSSSG